MLFVADQIPRELRRIVEFLNEQMNPAVVLALELRRFATVGDARETKTIVPVIFGQTERAAQEKKISPNKTSSIEGTLAALRAHRASWQDEIAAAKAKGSHELTHRGQPRVYSLAEAEERLANLDRRISELEERNRK